MGGLWKKFDHEKSLRKDKAKKGDYAEAFAEPAVQPSEPKQPFSISLTKSGVVIRKSRAWSGEVLRERVLKNFRRAMSGVFVVNSYKFSYAWTPEQFAEANGIELKRAKGLQGTLRGVVKQKRQFAENGSCERRSKTPTKLMKRRE